MNIPDKISQKSNGLKTGKSISINKISLGEPEKKKSGRFSYRITPVRYEEKPLEFVESGKLKIFSFNKKTFYLESRVNQLKRDPKLRVTSH